MAPRHCDHDIPESLIFILNDNPPLCLACQVQSRIDEIKQIQADLAWRGGIFVSKAHALSSPAGSEQRMQHKEITRRWRRVKRTLYEDLCFYEKLKEEEPDIALEWGVDNALAIWEKAEDACCWIPGYHYVEDETGDKNAEGAAKTAESEQEAVKETAVSYEAGTNRLLLPDFPWTPKLAGTPRSILKTPAPRTTSSKSSRHVVFDLK